MQSLKARVVILLLVAVMAFGAGSVALSQNGTGDIACDSDLVLLWYVADRYFGFGAVQNTVAQTAADPANVLDVTRINQGQFAPLFTALRGAQDPATLSFPGAALDANWLNRMAAIVQLDDLAFQDFLNSMQPANFDTTGLIGLVPASVAGEAPECSRLRAQLHRFFTAVAFEDVQQNFASTFGLNTNANLNLNDNTAGVNTNDNTAVNTNDNTGSTDVNTNDNTGANTNDNSGGGSNSNDDDNDNGNDNDDDDDNSGSGGGGGDNDNDDDDNDNDDNSGSGGGDDDNDND